MNGLLGGLGELLKISDQPEVEVDEGPSALELAMEEAIEKHAAENKAALGEANSIEPPVTITRAKGSAGVFGRRVTSVES